MLNRDQLRRYEDRLAELHKAGMGDSDEAVQLFQALAADANERERMADERWNGLHFGLRRAFCLN